VVGGQQKTAGVAGGLSGSRRVDQVRTLVQPPVTGENQKYTKKNGA
jgi:hypothetical protein